MESATLYRDGIQDQTRPSGAPNELSERPTLAAEPEPNNDVLDAIDHAHQQMLAAEIAEVVSIARAADRWEIDQTAVTEGMERLINPGHDGTPKVGEFLALEVGALLGVSPQAALGLIADALDLRHRHPRLWEAVLAGKMRVWQARKICFECSHLPLEVALKVDAAMAVGVAMLPFGRLMKALAGQIIAADTQVAKLREKARRQSRRIRVSQIADGSVNLFGIVDPTDGIVFDHVLNEIAAMLPTRPTARCARTWTAGAQRHSAWS